MGIVHGWEVPISWHKLSGQTPLRRYQAHMPKRLLSGRMIALWKIMSMPLVSACTSLGRLMLRAFHLSRHVAYTASPCPTSRPGRPSSTPTSQDTGGWLNALLCIVNTPPLPTPAVTLSTESRVFCGEGWGSCVDGRRIEWAAVMISDLFGNGSRHRREDERS